MIVDDIVALLVIALAYTERSSVARCAAAVLLFGVAILVARSGVRERHRPTSWSRSGSGSRWWTSGIHPTIAGVALGLLATAYPPKREELEVVNVALAPASGSSRTPSTARSATTLCASPCRRTSGCSTSSHPWTSSRDRPAVRARQRGRQDRSRPGTRRASPDHDRHHGRPVVGQARRDQRRRPGWRPGVAGPVPADGRAGRRSPARRRRRDRVHRRAADRRASRSRAPSWTRPSSGSSGVGLRRDAHLGGLPGLGRLPIAGTLRALSAPPTPLIDLADAGRPRRDHIRGRRKTRRHAGGVRRLRVPVLRAGRAGRRASCSTTSAASCATCSATCRSPTCTSTPSWRPRPRRPPARRAVLGDARSALRRQSTLGIIDLVNSAIEIGLDVPRFKKDLRDAQVHAARRARRRDAPTTVAWPEPRPSSSTVGGTRARTTSSRCPRCDRS